MLELSSSALSREPSEPQHDHEHRRSGLPGPSCTRSQQHASRSASSKVEAPSRSGVEETESLTRDLRGLTCPLLVLGPPLVTTTRPGPLIMTTRVVALALVNNARP